MSDPDPPQYKVYRSRRRPLSGLRAPGDLEGLRQRLGRRRPRTPTERPPLSPGRVVRWAAIAVVGWLALSLVLFFLSAQLENGVSDRSQSALSGGGSLLTGSTILVLGSDQRTGKSIDKSQTGPARADSIMLLHVAFGSVRKLSIPRDSAAVIPGHGPSKINAAYAIGGAPLMIETVERFMGHGIKINHLVEVDFEDFPKLIDSLGGIDVTAKTKICSPPFDNFWKGLTFKKGENHVDGAKALGFSRVRKNRCAPNETDIDRAQRQQEVFRGMRHRLFSPTTFFRLPLVSWRAPRALRSDMKGPGLLGLFSDMGSGGSGKAEVLEASCLGCSGTVPGGLVVSDGAKRDAARKLLGD